MTENIPINCNVCGKLGGELITDDWKRFHSSCAVCVICEKPNATNCARGKYQELVFLHDKCVFSPAQAEAFLKMRDEYKPE